MAAGLLSDQAPSLWDLAATIGDKVHGVAILGHDRGVGAAILGFGLVGVTRGVRHNMVMILVCSTHQGSLGVRVCDNKA